MRIGISTPARVGPDELLKLSRIDPATLAWKITGLRVSPDLTRRQESYSTEKVCPRHAARALVHGIPVKS
jgi:hypothetical protein